MARTTYNADMLRLLEEAVQQLTTDFGMKRIQRTTSRQKTVKLFEYGNGTAERMRLSFPLFAVLKSFAGR